MRYVHSVPDSSKIKLTRTYEWCALGHGCKRAFPGLSHADAFSVKNYELMTEFAKSRLTKYEVSEGGIMVGMAPGWDAAILEACVELGVPYALVVPKTDRDGFWAEGSFGAYDTYMAAAVETVIIHGGDDPSDVLNRDFWMIDRTSNALALYDGGEDGNTAQGYVCAGEKGRRRVNSWKNWVKRVQGVTE